MTNKDLVPRICFWFGVSVLALILIWALTACSDPLSPGSDDAGPRRLRDSYIAINDRIWTAYGECHIKIMPELVNVGTAPNASNGDPIYVANEKIARDIDTIAQQCGAVKAKVTLGTPIKGRIDAPSITGGVQCALGTGGMIPCDGLIKPYTPPPPPGVGRGIGGAGGGGNGGGERGIALTPCIYGGTGRDKWVSCSSSRASTSGTGTFQGPIP